MIASRPVVWGDVVDTANVQKMVLPKHTPVVCVCRESADEVGADRIPVGRYRRRDVSVPEGHDGNKDSDCCGHGWQLPCNGAPRTSA